MDLREPEEYEQYHIREALNFPGTRIKTDKFIPQLYAYKNKENKIIVVYHFDEKRGIDYITQLFEKGFDNIYLLNAGIEGFGQEVPEGLEGSAVPQFEKKEEVKKFKKTRIDWGSVYFSNIKSWLFWRGAGCRPPVQQWPRQFPLRLIFWGRPCVRLRSWRWQWQWGVSFHTIWQWFWWCSREWRRSCWRCIFLVMGGVPEPFRVAAGLTEDES